MKQVTIKPGENVWIFERTSVDGKSDEYIANSVGGYMMNWLKSVQSASIWQIITTRKYTWRIGNARPTVTGLPSHDRPEVWNDVGEMLCDKQSVDPVVVPTVIGIVNQWYVTVRFWWRGVECSVPYPAIVGSNKVWGEIETPNSEAFLVGIAQWVLARAFVPATKSPDQGDQTWGQAEVGSVKASVDAVSNTLATAISWPKTAALVGIVGLVTVGVVYVLSGKRGSN
jgi:hypothetical protein